MQGPVYGIFTEESSADDRLLPNFHYDDIFGTVVNRFICQAVAGIPLTVFGKGGRTRGYLNLKDTMRCIELAAEIPASQSELRIFNQLTETFSVNQLAVKVKSVGDGLGLEVQIDTIPNPRVEMEDHYYNVKHTGLVDLGLEPTFMTDEVLGQILSKVIERKELISAHRAMPRVKWNKKV